MVKRRFRDLSSRNRVLLVVLGIVQVSLNAAAQIDITRRAADEIRGPKFAWRLVSMVNIVGPVAYFVRGRRMQD